MKDDYSLISFILRGKRRKTVLKCLNSPKIPKDIATECNLSISNVSNTLPELVKKGLVKCKNPKDHYYKYYELTNLGNNLLKKLNL
ncbi:ArsR family transcriptional regulator [Candidatus Pacearchaeota archaeon]|nr:ArsR family transcriptional regulator [Candidatus Pacearchaeota archaeon]